MQNFRPYILDNIPNVFTTINIENEIRNYTKNRNSAPAIIFDLPAIPLRVRNYYDNFCGGRHQLNQELVISFFERLKALKARMFFVVKAEVDSSDKWHRRKKSQFINEHHIAKDIHNGCDFESIMQKHGKKVSYMPIIKYDLRLIASKYGVIINSLKYDDVSNDLVQIAKQENALAIVSDKSSLIFYPNTFQYWTACELDLTEMTCKVTRQDKIIKHFNLSPLELKFFGVLTGCCASENLQNFLVDFIQRIPADTNQFEAIASFLNKTMKSSDADYIEVVAKAVAGREMNNVDNIREALKESLKRFTIVEQELIPDERIRYVLNHNHKNNYNILSGKPLHYFSMFYSKRQNTDLQFPDIISPLIRRKSGVILKNDSDKNMKVSFYSFGAEFKRPVVLETVEPIYPNFALPKIEELMNQEYYESYNPERFKVLCWIIAQNKLDYFEISWINDRYMMIVVTLYFLVQNKYIRVFEADAILLTSKAVIDKKIMPDLEYPAFLQSRTFHTAFLYLDIFQHISEIFESVGLSDKIFPMAFDGVYYHNFVSTWNELSQPERQQLLKEDENVYKMRQVYLKSVDHGHEGPTPSNSSRPTYRRSSEGRPQYSNNRHRKQ